MWNFSVVALKIRTRTSHTTTWNLWVEGFCTSLTVLILGHLIQCQGDILNKNNGNGSGRCYSCFLHIACCWLRCVWRFLSSSCFQFNLEDSGILCKCCGLSFEANGASSIVESGWRMGQRKLHAKIVAHFRLKHWGYFTAGVFPQISSTWWIALLPHDSLLLCNISFLRPTQVEV